MSLSPRLLATLRVAADGFGYTHARHGASDVTVARRYAALRFQGLLSDYGSTYATLTETGRAALSAAE